MASASSASAQDPFYVVRDELSSKIEYIKVRLERYNDLLQNTNTAQNRDFMDLRKGLQKEVRAADGQLRDLRRTVEYVENNPSNFPHIDKGELKERKSFLSGAKQAILAARADLDGEKTKDKLARDEQSELAKYRPTGDLGAASALERDNTEYVHDQQARVRMQLARQDHDLEELGEHVERVGEHATIINEELRSQNRMLTELDDDLEEAAEKMNFVMGKLARLLKTKDKCHIWTVVILCVVLAILVVLLIYT